MNKEHSMTRRIWFGVLTALIGLSMLPGPARAKSICIWQTDSLDRYYEPAAEARVRATWGLRKALTASGHEVHSFYALPDDLSSYDAVFVSLGWSRG
jgi:hypothetical protein